jgi:hypothetical protein
MVGLLAPDRRRVIAVAVAIRTSMPPHAALRLAGTVRSPAHYLRTDPAQPGVVSAGPYQAADGLSLEAQPTGYTAAKITGGTDNENHDRSTSNWVEVL